MKDIPPGAGWSLNQPARGGSGRQLYGPCVSISRRYLV